MAPPWRLRAALPAALVALLALRAARPAPARAQDPAPAPAPRRGHYEVVLRHGAPYAELEVGGAKGLFLIDTGANTSGVDRGWLERSGARWRPAGRTTVGGTTGALGVDRCVVDRLDLGAGFFRDAVLTVQAFDGFAPPLPDRPQAGLIGTDLLRSYQLSFDWPNARIELLLPAERRPPPPGHEAVACAFPANLPTVSARVGGLTLPCRLDTGATTLGAGARLDVNVAAVEALRARGVRLVTAGHITLRGVSGSERLEALKLDAPDEGLALEIGPARVEEVTLIVHPTGTLAVRYPLALASATLLSRLHRLTLDPFDHLLWVPLPEPRTGPRIGPL